MRWKFQRELPKAKLQREATRKPQGVKFQREMTHTPQQNSKMKTPTSMEQKKLNPSVLKWTLRDEIQRLNYYDFTTSLGTSHFDDFKQWPATEHFPRGWQIVTYQHVLRAYTEEQFENQNVTRDQDQSIQSWQKSRSQGIAYQWTCWLLDLVANSSTSNKI